MVSSRCRGLAPIGYQPSPILAARRIAGPLSPPIHSAGHGFCTGLGANRMSENLTKRPSNRGLSFVHSSRNAIRYSSVAVPRSANGGASIATNSSSSQPDHRRRPPGAAAGERSHVCARRRAQEARGAEGLRPLRGLWRRRLPRGDGGDAGVVWDASTGAVSASFLARHGRRSAVRPQVRSGCAVFSVGFVLAIWAITTIRRAGTRVETNKPTTAIVENGPYRFRRNPIY